MRKNYFAKKFVAYSMAFAVAFSTLTVSPVFVKEAKAAPRTAYEVSIGGDEMGSYAYGTVIATNTGAVLGVNLVNGATLISDMTSEDATNGTNISGLSVLKSKLPTLTNVLVTKGAAIDNSLAYSYTIGGKDTSTNGSDGVSAKGDKPVKLNGKTTLKVNKTDADHRWFKLVPGTDSLSVNVATNVYEKVNISYFTLLEVGAGDLDLGVVTEDELGLYIEVDDDAKTVPTKVINVYEESDLTATAQAKNSTVASYKGGNVTLSVDVTSTKAVTYKWRKNTTTLDSTTNTLALSNLTANDFGSYVCEVSDGIKTIPVSIIVRELNTTDFAAVRTAVKDIETVKLATDSTNSDKLIGGKVTLKTSIPEDGDYKFIWTQNHNSAASDSVATLVEADKLAYNAANRSITITDSTLDVNDVITCYAVPAKVYDEAMKTELANVANASSEIKKYDEIGTLRTNELTKTYKGQKLTNAANYIYKETITLLDAESVETSSTVSAKFGDVLTLTTPNIDKAKAYKWTLEDGTTSYTTTVNKLTINTVDFTTFGQIKVEALGCDNDPVHTSTQDCTDWTKDLGVTGADNTINVLYNSDLKVEASDVVAKVGQENVELKVNATATLPVSYEWSFVPVKTVNYAKSGSGAADSTKADYTQTEAAAAINPLTSAYGIVNENVVTIPKILKQEDDQTGTGKTLINHFFVAKDAKHKVDANYFECKVTDGVKSETVTVKVSEVNTFKVYETQEDAEDKVREITSTKTISLSNLAESKEVLSPVVVAASDAIEKEITYKWTKAGTVVGTDKTLDVTYPKTGTESYVLTITEGTKKVVLTYALSVLTEKEIKDAADLKEADRVDFNVALKDKGEIVYTGNEINPISKVTTTISGSTYTLVEGTDYNVSLEDAINTGYLTAKYTINFIGNFANVDATTPLEGRFSIVRADNKLAIEDKTVVLGGSVQPKTINLSKGAVTYTYYADEACTTALEAAPTKVGTYYVKATSIATTNYNEATSNVATVKVVPGKVKMLGTSRTASSVKLNWTKATGATSYRVYYKAPGDKSYKVFKNTTATSMNVTGLASATTYTFAVKAYAKTAGYSTVYATKKTTTAPAKVAKPTVTAGSKKATVKFDKVARATGYQIYMAKGNGSYKKVATTKSLSFTKNGLAKGATYKFKVRAYKTVGSNTYYGAFSSAKAVVVK